MSSPVKRGGGTPGPGRWGENSQPQPPCPWWSCWFCVNTQNAGHSYNSSLPEVNHAVCSISHRLPLLGGQTHEPQAGRKVGWASWISQGLHRCCLLLPGAPGAPLMAVQRVSPGQEQHSTRSLLLCSLAGDLGHMSGPAGLSIPTCERGRTTELGVVGRIHRLKCMRGSAYLPHKPNPG